MAKTNMANAKTTAEILSDMTALTRPPATFAGIPAVTLCSYPSTAGDGDCDTANSDTSGRTVTDARQFANSANGDATHNVLDDGVTLLYGTTCPRQTVVSGSPCNVGAFDVEIGDPT